MSFSGFLFQGYIKSKNLPTHSIKSLSRKDVTTAEGNFILWLYTPGNLGIKGTLSLQNMDGRWLRQESDLINAQQYERSFDYLKATDFWVRPSAFLTGYNAFESSLNPGHYIRHSNSQLKVETNAGTSAFHDDASWIIRESGKFLSCIFQMCQMEVLQSPEINQEGSSINSMIFFSGRICSVYLTS